MTRDLYQLIIVDDEKTIREGLSKFINWNELGFEIVGCFANGVPAIEFLKTHEVHVVLTDIKMARASGVDVARFIHQNKKDIKVVFLTGYKDFEYARQAIELDVVHYLLKPTQLPELYEVFTKIKLQLNSEFKEIQNLKTLKQTLYEQFFLDIFLGALINKKDIEEKAALLDLDIDFETTHCAVLCLCVKNYENYIEKQYKFGKEQFYSAIYNFLVLKYNDIHFVSVYRYDGLVKFIIYSNQNLDSMQDNLQSTIEELWQFMNLDVSIFVEYQCENIFDLAEKSLAYNKSTEHTQDTNHFKQLVEQQKLLMSHILSGDDELSYTLLNSVIKSLDEIELDMQKDLVEYLFNSMLKNLANMGYYYNLADIHDQNDDKIFDHDSLLQWARNKLRSIIHFIKNNSGGSENFVINKAREYINENYYLDISLEDVASYVFLSPAYFSRIFKKYCNENFSEYLLKLRMQKAKAFLRNSQYKVYEIAEKVGFKTLKYFYKLFKQYTGVTPTEYRSSIFHSNEEYFNE